MSNEHRHRLRAVAKTLRQFGLTDEFGICDEFAHARLPSKKKIEALLKSGPRLLPRGISASLIAGSVSAAVADTEDSLLLTPDPALDLLSKKLSKIKPGRADAALFHDTTLSLLKLIFDTRLGSMTKEKKLLQGRKRLDIRARNSQAQGFFHDLRTKHAFYCPYIFCECKNYAEDLANAEFDQLLGRLNGKSTNVGLLICRTVADQNLVLQRCRDPYFSEGKLVIALTDKDIRKLATLRAKSDIDAIDTYLEDKLEEVKL